MVLSEKTVQTIPYATSSMYMNIIYRTLQSTTNRIASVMQTRKYGSTHTLHMRPCGVGYIDHKATLLEKLHERFVRGRSALHTYAYSAPA